MLVSNRIKPAYLEGGGSDQLVWFSYVVFFVAVATEKCLNSYSFVSWIIMGKALDGEEKG